VRVPVTTSAIRLLAAVGALVGVLSPAAAAPAAGPGADVPRGAAWPGGVVVVGYGTRISLEDALNRNPGTVVRRLPALRAAVVRPVAAPADFAARVSRRAGISYVQPLRRREPAVEPALLPSPYPTGTYEWQFGATRSDTVPEEAVRAASAVTVAVIDSGADLAAPDLAAKAPATWNISTGARDVTDSIGHGTFVAALAAGAPENEEGIAGFGGDARLLVIKAGTEAGLTDVEAADAIAYAVDHGARIVNLSFGGATASATERRAIDYAASKDVLLVAAAGNDFANGNAAQYPAALLQPVGSDGRGGTGLAVAASTWQGTRAPFSSTGSYVSLAAPGENVFSAVSSRAPADAFPRVSLQGSRSGQYGFASGTSFAAPEVAGAAAVVWAANPNLHAVDVARVLKESAQGLGSWTPELGYGVIDVAAAVARAPLTTPGPAPKPLARASSKLLVLAFPTGGKSPLKGRLTAVLRSSDPRVSAGERQLVLESFVRGRWRSARKAATTPSGMVEWRYSLRRGTYRVRVRYAGSRDLTAAKSRTVELTSR
jgi:subtilisin family serine protease